MSLLSFACHISWPLCVRGLHGPDFQPQFQSTPWTWIQIHSTPTSELNGTADPNPYQSKHCFNPYRVKILIVFVSNPSSLSHICQSIKYNPVSVLLLSCFVKVRCRHIVLCLHSAQLQSNPYDFHKLCPISTPFPLHIHFHMDFHSTEGLYSAWWLSF